MQGGICSDPGAERLRPALGGGPERRCGPRGGGRDGGPRGGAADGVSCRDGYRARGGCLVPGRRG
jgi:hypothetical protein